MDQLLPPSAHCRRLGHSIQHYTRSAGSGQIEFCAVCSLGYTMALVNFDGDTDKADDFVRSLRV